jgi:hypothetical protein
MATNITEAHRLSFNALCSGEYENFALLSCVVNGEPASAIVVVHEDGAGYRIEPLFVSVTEGMTITDHGGVEA